MPRKKKTTLLNYDDPKITAEMLARWIFGSAHDAAEGEGRPINGVDLDNAKLNYEQLVHPSIVDPPHASDVWWDACEMAENKFKEYEKGRKNPRRRFVDAPAHLRCTATIHLSDGSPAQCGRYAKVNGKCRQHAKKKNPLYRTGKYLLFTKEKPEGRSNKVRYLLPGMEKPWNRSQGFGPELDDVLDKSKRQAALILALRNPRGTKKIRIKHGKRTLLVTLCRNPDPGSVLSFFNERSQKEALEPVLYKRRDKVIRMSPAVFLDMAMPLFEPMKSKMENLHMLVSKGIPLETMPVLSVNRDGEVIGHEGRHRAMLFESMGFKEIPVVISSANIRWSEQTDPSRFDYIKDWPEWLISEDGSRSIRFPIKRSDAEKPAWK